MMVNKNGLDRSQLDITLISNSKNLKLHSLKDAMLLSGMDGGKFDWVKVRTSYVNDLLMCNFYSFLDGNDHEMGSGCTITG